MTSVVHVITRYGLGGSERRLRDAIAATPYLDHSVVVGYEQDGELVRAHLPMTPVEILPCLRRSADPRADLPAYRWLSDRLSRGDVNLLHTHQSKAGALGRLAGWRRGVPSIHSLSMANFGVGFSPVASAAHRIVEGLLGRHTAGYAVVGTDLRDRYARLGIPADRFTVIRSTIELGRFRGAPTQDAAAAALGVDRTHGAIAYVGRFERLKGVEELPKLLVRLKSALGAAPTMILAGDGPLRALVVERCRSAIGENAVVDLGYTSRIPEVMAAADAVVLLSRCEGVPQVLVQALSTGRPFVAYAADGAHELAALPGADGCRVVPIGDLQGAVSGVLEVLRRRGRPVVDLGDWSPERVYPRYRDLYDRILCVRTARHGV